MSNLYVSWDQYNTQIERLALNVYASGYEFNQIICIARGGMRVGDVLSRIFDKPLAILSTHSYAAEGGTIRGELVIAEHMTLSSPQLGDRVLLVDDMVDSGVTLAAVHKTLPQRWPVIRTLPDRGAVVEGLLHVQARFLRRLPGRQSVDPPAVRDLRHAAPRGIEGPTRETAPGMIVLSGGTPRDLRDTRASPLATPSVGAKIACEFGSDYPQYPRRRAFTVAPRRGDS